MQWQEDSVAPNSKSILNLNNKFALLCIMYCVVAECCLVNRRLNLLLGRGTLHNQECYQKVWPDIPHIISLSNTNSFFHPLCQKTWHFIFHQVELTSGAFWSNSITRMSWECVNVTSWGKTIWETECFKVLSLHYIVHNKKHCSHSQLGTLKDGFTITQKPRVRSHPFQFSENKSEEKHTRREKRHHTQI